MNSKQPEANGDAQKAVFKITYECQNCGGIFFEEYRKGDEVEYNLMGYYYLHTAECKNEGKHNKCRKIVCQNCDSENVSIKKRMAI